MKQAGRILYIPVLLSFLRQITFTLKLLKKSIYSRSEQTFLLRIISEIFDTIFFNKSLTLKKINKINDIAFKSQPNLHFRWKKKLP
jgi:ribosomal protein S7